MDIEKYTNSKLYFIFEWGFKLIMWNLLSLLIICIVAGIPFVFFFHIQDNHAIDNVEISGEELVVTQHDGKVTNIGEKVITGEIKEIKSLDNAIVLILNDYQIQVNNPDNIKNITGASFIDNELIISHKLSDESIKDTNFGNIYDSDIDIESSRINSYQEAIIVYQNGVNVNYGKVLETQGTLSGVLVIIGLALAIFSFIPTYVTIFSMIKIFAEDGSANTFILYFDRLWDNFKALYKLDIALVIITVLFGYGLFSYYNVIHSLDTPNYFLIISYNIILICSVIVVLFILSLPMTVGYFRMKTMSIIKFTISMTFRNILYAIIYLILLVLPLLLCFLNNFFIPIWFLIGLSIPLLFMYIISSGKYHRIVKDFNNYKEEDIYEFEEEENETRN